MTCHLTSHKSSDEKIFPKEHQLFINVYLVTVNIFYLYVFLLTPHSSFTSDFKTCLPARSSVITFKSRHYPDLQEK